MEYTVTFSHSYEDGHSGPARSYWDFNYGPIPLGTVCLHREDEKTNPELTANGILHMLEKAFEQGAASARSCAFSDGAILQLNLHDEDPRLSQLCDEVREQVVRTILEALTTARDDGVEAAQIAEDAIAALLREDTGEADSLIQQLTAIRSRIGR